MLLDNIINGTVQITEKGIQCATPDGAWRVFNFMRQAILDRHIYISKAVGVQFVKDVHAKASVNGNIHIEGYYNCGESYPELMVHLSDKIYLVPPNTESIDIQCNPGVVNVPDVLNTAGVLYRDPYMLRVLTNSMVMRLILKYDCGFRTMSYNSKVSSKMFPFYTDNSLADFVRVLPMERGQTFVPMKFLHGMNVVKFNMILKNWHTAIVARDINKEELLWLQRFGQ